MNFERGKDIKSILDLGLIKYIHVMRAYKLDADGIQKPFPLDDLVEFLRSGGKKYNSNHIMIRIVKPGEESIRKMHRYWKNSKEGLPEEGCQWCLWNLRGSKIIIKGKIYLVS